MNFLSHFKISRVPKEIKKTSVLILLGARWHCQSLVDLKLNNKLSFIDMLNKEGIDVFCLDNLGTGPTNSTEYCGNLHKDNIKNAKKIINEFNIEYVIAYSYGTTIAASLATTNIKGLIFVDPISKIPNNITAEIIENGDKFLIQISHLKDKLKELTEISEIDIVNHCLKLSVSDEVFITPTYTINETKKMRNEIVSHDFWNSFSEKSLLVVTTKHADPDLPVSYIKRVKHFENASHWIFIEPFAEDLSLEISKFIKNNEQL